MRTIETEKMEKLIAGGGSVSSTILGVCTGLGVAGLIGLIVIPEPTSKVIAGACIVNGIAAHFNWW